MFDGWRNHRPSKRQGYYSDYADYRTKPTPVRRAYSDHGLDNYGREEFPGQRFFSGSFSDGFPFRVIQIMGAIHLVLGALLLILGVATAALATPMLASILNMATMPFAIVCVVVFGLMAIIVGVLCILHSPSRMNLEAYRNSQMVLSILLCLGCIGTAIYESIVAQLFTNIVGSYNLSGVNHQNDVYGLYITLIVFTFLEGVMGGITASVGCCCSPRCCTPLVNADFPDVFEYDRGMLRRPNDDFRPRSNMDLVPEYPRGDLVPAYSRGRSSYPSYATYPRKSKPYTVDRVVDRVPDRVVRRY